MAGGSDETDPQDESAPSDHPESDASSDAASEPTEETAHPETASHPADSQPAAKPADTDRNGNESFRFSVDDIPVAGTETDSDDAGGNVTGGMLNDQPLEPGDINPEHALFVVLGIVLVVGLLGGALLGF